MPLPSPIQELLAFKSEMKSTREVISNCHLMLDASKLKEAASLISAASLSNFKRHLFSGWTWEEMSSG